MAPVQMVEAPPGGAGGDSGATGAGASRTDRVHLHGLDGLRGVTVVAIMAYHLGFGWAQGLFWSVDLFFIVSGYLITGLLLDRTPGSIAEMRSWWGRRIRRLTPAVTVTVIAVLIAFATTAGISRDAFATMTWWQNWNLIVEGTSYWSTDPSPLRHAWTLSIEEQFYLTWPLILLAAVALARRMGRSRTTVVGVVAAVLGAMSVSWAAYLALAGADLNRVYYGTDTRAGALLLGCAAGAFLHGRPKGAARRALVASPTLNAASMVAILGLVALSAVLQIDRTFTYTGGLLLAGIASLVLVVVVSRPGPMAEFFSNRTLTWVGVRSYGLYLWSWPTQLFVQAQLPGASPAGVAAITVPVSVLLAWLSLKFVEQPLRSRSDWAAALAPRRVAWASGAVAVVAGMVLLVGNGGPRSVSEEVSATESVDLALAPPPTAPPTTTTTTTTPPTTAPTTAAPGARADAGAEHRRSRLLRRRLRRRLHHRHRPG